MVGQLDELETKLASMRYDPEAQLDAHHVRLARVLDSYGRYASGSFGGIHVNRALGAYEQCLESSGVSAAAAAAATALTARTADTHFRQRQNQANVQVTGQVC